MNISPQARGNQPAGSRPGFCPGADSQTFVGAVVAQAAFNQPADGLTIREHFALHIFAGLLAAQGPAFAATLGEPDRIRIMLDFHDRAAKLACVLADDLLVELSKPSESPSQYAKDFRDPLKGEVSP